MSITETQLLERGKKACYETFEHDKALNLYEQTIKLNPNYANAYNTKASCFYCLKEYEEAVEYYSKAIELNLNDLNSKEWKQKALEQIGLKQDK